MYLPQRTPMSGRLWPVRLCVFSGLFSCLRRVVVPSRPPLSGRQVRAARRRQEVCRCEGPPRHARRHPARRRRRGRGVPFAHPGSAYRHRIPMQGNNGDQITTRRIDFLPGKTAHARSRSLAARAGSPIIRFLAHPSSRSDTRATMTVRGSDRWQNRCDARRRHQLVIERALRQPRQQSTTTVRRSYRRYHSADDGMDSRDR